MDWNRYGKQGKKINQFWKEWLEANELDQIEMMERLPLANLPLDRSVKLKLLNDMFSDLYAFAKGVQDK